MFAESLGDFEQLINLQPSQDNFVLRYTVVVNVLKALIFLHDKGLYHGNLTKNCIKYRQGRVTEIKVGDYYFCQLNSVRKMRHALPDEPLKYTFDIYCVGKLLNSLMFKGVDIKEYEFSDLTGPI